MTGDGGWNRPWGPVFAAAERTEGRGYWRVCQMDILNRIRTNPAAHLFASRLLSPGEKGQPAIAPLDKGPRTH